MSDTIYALSSGRPPAGIGIVRISGPQAFEVNRLFTGISSAPTPRQAVLHSLRDPTNGDLLDRALILAFEGPKSATGEDVVEWHCHGGSAVIQAVLAALGRSSSLWRLREAEAGEFTRRAFENQRIDLNEAQGLADLLAAQTESQRRSALLMAEGHFSRRLEGWRADLLGCAALTESLLDFSDEDDVPEEGAIGKLRRAIALLYADMEHQLAAPAAERLNEGIRVVLAGPPNAGKSTLLNALAGRDAAIVSEIAGTTRDRIDISINLGGIAFTVTDTAGLIENSGDRIERIGVDLARQAMEQCDILLWLGNARECPRADAIRIAAQMDRKDWHPALVEGADIALSAVTGENMAVLVEKLVARGKSLIPAEGSYALHRRQRESVASMAEELRLSGEEADLLIIAECLRACLGEMDRLVGRSGVEDMLDSLFARFCIGK